MLETYRMEVSVYTTAITDQVKQQYAYQLLCGHKDWQVTKILKDGNLDNVSNVTSVFHLVEEFQNSNGMILFETGVIFKPKFVVTTCLGIDTCNCGASKHVRNANVIIPPINPNNEAYLYTYQCNINYTQ